MSVSVTPKVDSTQEEWNEIHRLQGEIHSVQSKAVDRTRKAQRDWTEKVRSSFIISHEHIALLKRMDFQLHENTDLVSVGAEGKRPFGNGDWVEDIFSILGWQRSYDADGLTDECVERAKVIMAQLPMALNQMIADFSVGTGADTPAGQEEE